MTANYDGARRLQEKSHVPGVLPLDTEFGSATILTKRDTGVEDIINDNVRKVADLGPSHIMSTTSPSPISQSPDKGWLEHLTFDLFLKVLNRTLFHPFLAWVGVLSLRAQATPYTHISFMIATGYAAFLMVLALARAMNQRLAHGLPRPVDLSEEVVVVTGGASGLGLLIARIYGLRGVSVAVLDIKAESDIEGWEEVTGVDYYRCDITDREAVERMARRIKEEVCNRFARLQPCGRYNDMNIYEIMLIFLSWVHRLC